MNNASHKPRPARTAAHPLSKLGRAEVGRFKIPYLVLADGAAVLRTFDPEDARDFGLKLSQGRADNSIAFLRVGDAESLRWCRDEAEFPSP